MKAQIPIEWFLKVVSEFNYKYPGSHVGGSIGLFLYGIDLKRPLGNSDLDMVIATPLPNVFEIENSTESSAHEDFDIQLRVHPDNGAVYIKVDITVRPESEFAVIIYEGIQYNVSLKEDILSWKQKYADKGVQKHIDDLITIQTGIRPEQKVTFAEVDDLPF